MQYLPLQEPHMYTLYVSDKAADVSLIWLAAILTILWKKQTVREFLILKDQLLVTESYQPFFEIRNTCGIFARHFSTNAELTAIITSPSVYNAFFTQCQYVSFSTNKFLNRYIVQSYNFVRYELLQISGQFAPSVYLHRKVGMLDKRLSSCTYLNKILSFKTHTSPSSVNATEPSSLQPTLTTFFSTRPPFTSSGELRFVCPWPVPVCPNWLLPQPYTWNVHQIGCIFLQVDIR